VTNPFSKTTLWVVISVAIISLVTTVVLTVLGSDPGDKTSAGSDGYSKSAIGHRALIELLGKLDVPVVVSRNNSSAKSEKGLLIIAEPKQSEKEAERLRALVLAAPNILVVLPKWYGFVGHKREWIASADMLPKTDVVDVLHEIGVDVSNDPLMRTPLPIAWRTRDGYPRPSIQHPQAIAIDVIEPVIDDGTHALLGHFEHEGKQIWVLADPDVLNNAGLRKPENAALAIMLIDKLRDGGPVVFDETVHGHVQTPSLLRVLFGFPLVLATIQVLVCALLAIWAAMVRFGPRRAAPPPLAPGKDFLIENTAALLRYGGHHVDALQRYLAATVVQVRQTLHAPDHLGPSALGEWFERVRLLRGGTIGLFDLEKQVGSAAAHPQRVVELADLVYRWRMEMTHGPKHRT
jgi:hypothetical protein